MVPLAVRQSWQGGLFFSDDLLQGCAHLPKGLTETRDSSLEFSAVR